MDKTNIFKRYRFISMLFIMVMALATTMNVGYSQDYNYDFDVLWEKEIEGESQLREYDYNEKDDILYVYGEETDTIYYINNSNGEVINEEDAPELIDRPNKFSYHNEHFYVQNSSMTDGYTFFKFDENWDKVWEFEQVDNWITEIAFDDEGNIYIGLSSGDGIYSINPQGEVNYEIEEFNLEFRSSMTIDDDSNLYVSGRNEYNMSKFDKEGNLIWENEELTQKKSYIQTSPNNELVAFNETHRSMVDKETGDIISSYEFDSDLLDTINFNGDSIKIDEYNNAYMVGQYGLVVINEQGKTINSYYDTEDFNTELSIILDNNNNIILPMNVDFDLSMFNLNNTGYIPPKFIKYPPNIDHNFIVNPTRTYVYYLEDYVSNFTEFEFNITDIDDTQVCVGNTGNCNNTEYEGEAFNIEYNETSNELKISPQQIEYYTTMDFKFSNEAGSEFFTVEYSSYPTHSAIGGVIKDIGKGLGNFISAIAQPILYIIIVLGMAGAMVGLIYAFTTKVREGLNLGKRK